MEYQCDYLVIGTGLAGLAFALKVADTGKVLILAKSRAAETNTNWAQGGIAAVKVESVEHDSFEDHIRDTLVAGAGLCHENIVKMVVEQGPDRIQDLVDWGVEFEGELHQEGGHGKRRIYHVHDYTGRAVHSQLLKKALAHPNIEILEEHFAIDLILRGRVDREYVGGPQCIGAYVLNRQNDEIFAIRAKATCLATGGVGKVYLYTSNWSGATGDGIAMAFRAGARVSNLEFMQFHPTCLYHPQARNFLITEALRGEGGELINAAGEAFMKKYDERGSLAPRDIVARSIDAEMKKTGASSVFLDISHRSKDFLESHFPVIYQRCLELGIDMATQPIPVVPAAHYLCGGILTDRFGRTDVEGLFAIGESACSGLHGANRLASNSLLECVVFAHNAATYLKENESLYKLSETKIPRWKKTEKKDQDEIIVITHMWDEIRRLMWNYVGIVRSNKRLERARSRLQNILSETKEYYWDFKVHPDILELRNIALVAHLTVECALKRQESRGIHFNIDFPDTLPDAKDTVISPSHLIFASR